MRYISERSCDFTKHPTLFENTYWGGYNKLEERDRINETKIGENRNKLVEIYNLKKVILNYKIPVKTQKQSCIIIDEKDIRDHIEYYKLNGGTILTIFSRDGLSEQTCEIIKQHGYILFEPLYAIGQQSYLKII